LELRTRPLAGVHVQIAIEKNWACQANQSVNEASLVSALRRNDPEAFETVVGRFGGRMLAVARRYLDSEQDCADAVQDAFISAFQAIAGFEGNSQLGTWLHRIVINACLMKVRSRSRRHEISIEGLLPTFNADGHHAQPPRRWRLPPVTNSSSATKLERWCAAASTCFRMTIATCSCSATSRNSAPKKPRMHSISA